MTAFYDTPVAKGAGKTAPGDIWAIAHTGIGKGAGKGRVSVEALAGVDTDTGKGAGKGGGADSYNITESSTGKGAGSGVDTSVAKQHEFSAAAVGAGKSLVSGAYTIAESLFARAAGKAIDTSVMVAADASAGKSAARAVSGDVGALADAPTGRGAGKGGGTDRSTLRDALLVGGAGRSNTAADLWVARDTPTAKASGAGSGTNAMVASDTLRATVGAAQGSVCTSEEFDYNDLIKALRYNWLQSDNTLSDIPEGLPSETQFDQLVLPYGVILAHHPRSEMGFAVNDFAQWVSVDFLLIDKQTRNSVVDSAQVLRKRLGKTIQKVLQDYHELASTGVRVSSQTELVAAPLDRMNQYQQYYNENGQPVSVMVLTMDFLVVRSLVCG